MTEEEDEEEEEEEGCSRWISFECFFFSFLLWGTVKTKTDALVFFSDDFYGFIFFRDLGVF